MSQITTEEISRDPQAFLRRLEAGETLLVIRDQTPLAEVKPFVVPTLRLRPYGLCAGLFTVPDDFDDPLPESVLKDFEGT